MKKKVPATTEAPLLPSVVERVDGTRRKGKPQRLPAAAEMPAVEVIMLDGTRALGDRALQFAVMQSSKAFAWMRVFSALEELVRDPDVTQDPAAIEFVKVMVELSRGGVLANSAEEALLPVVGLLPAGRLGEKSSAAHAESASAPRKLWPADIEKLRRKYADRLKSGERHGAIRELARKGGYSETTVRHYVKDLIPKRSHQ